MRTTALATKRPAQWVGDKAAWALKEPGRMSIIKKVLKLLVSPSLPEKILVVSGTLATVIIVTGVGIWTIFGAVTVFLRLIR